MKIETQQMIMVSDPEGFITKKEIARRLRRPVRTIEKWQATGILPFYKCGRTVLFRWPDVEAHLTEHFRVCHPRICGEDGETKKANRRLG
jgi:excisionase family DNA binding protein